MLLSLCGRKKGKLHQYYIYYVCSLYSRFPNDACQGDGGGKNGTCYTKEECSTKGGEEIGSCASGFGVCCLSNVHTHSGESTEIQYHTF